MCYLQTSEKKGELGEVEPPIESSSEPTDSSNSRSCGASQEEPPFIKLSQEEYGEHHSSIMHCRSVCHNSPTLRIKTKTQP